MHRENQPLPIRTRRLSRRGIGGRFPSADQDTHATETQHLVTLGRVRLDEQHRLGPERLAGGADAKVRRQESETKTARVDRRENKSSH